MKQLRAEATAPSPVEDAVADLSPAGYVAETLRRAALNNGTAPGRAAEYCDGTFTRWSFTPDGGLVRWTCTALKRPPLVCRQVKMRLPGPATDAKSGRSASALSGSSSRTTNPLTEFGNWKNTWAAASGMKTNTESYSYMPTSKFAATS